MNQVDDLLDEIAAKTGMELFVGRYALVASDDGVLIGSTKFWRAVEAHRAAMRARGGQSG